MRYIIVEHGHCLVFIRSKAHLILTIRLYSMIHSANSENIMRGILQIQKQEINAMGKCLSPVEL